jgi:putative addiction module component (TIGR02574 family)
MSATEILEQIRRLPENERREVTGQILEEFGDIDDGLSAEQIDELERRAAEARAHPERGIPWETVRAELYARYNVEQ